ncbi:MAG TPA: M2 family metallopeptidase [Candidatus Nanopelagicales bacterium]|nr:M2 family metallopeptidase [Candidatus Nanopelagicales bacterium]
MNLPTPSGPRTTRLAAWRSSFAAVSLAALGLTAACSANVQVGSGAPGAPTASPPAAATPAAPAAPTVDVAARVFAGVDAELRRLWTHAGRASWINQTYITDDTDALSASAEEASMEYLNRIQKEATRFDGMQLPPELDRQRTLLKLATTMPAPSDAKKRAELAELTVGMNSAYGKGKYCPAKDKTKLGKWLVGGKGKPAKECLTLDDLSKVMRESQSWDELAEAWAGWHAIAPPLRKEFQRYVELGNEGAKEIGFSDLGALWRSGYDMTPEQFEAETDRLWGQVKPLYDELHCYVRAQLGKRHGKDKIGDKAPIPAHLLGNMWAQDWANVYDQMVPYPGQPSLDVTKKLEAKKVGAKEMVRMGERFFTSLGIDPLPKTFWERSLFTKPEDREVVCHASAWDVGFQDDLRIKMCIQPNEEDLITIHHELGHNYYYHYYYKLPILFQSGANDGFHEGIGDTLALSVTPDYLKSLGLIDKVPDNDKGQINFLFKQALGKVSFLPFGKLIDQWRWDVFAGKTKPADYNKAWWALRQKYQGVAAPMPRSEADFDPGAKYHVPASVPYTRYFLAHIYQFQFHRALCQAAGHKGPLHTCSIHDSKAAGDKLKAMLALGASRPWQEAMQAITGQREADPSALLEYFEPLRAWLKEQNKAEVCGW